MSKILTRFYETGSIRPGSIGGSKTKVCATVRDGLPIMQIHVLCIKTCHNTMVGAFISSKCVFVCVLFGHIVHPHRLPGRTLNYDSTRLTSHATSRGPINVPACWPRAQRVHMYDYEF